VKVDIGNILYTVAMILLAFVVSIMVTKRIGKYINKKNKE